MAYRQLPFGYGMKDGCITIDPYESDIVRQIFTLRAEGQSYKQIADGLTCRAINYTADCSVWNKNIIDRILKNDRYFGRDDFPKIIEPPTYSKATQTPDRDTKDNGIIKAVKKRTICAKCGEKLERRIKADGGVRWICSSNTKHIPTTLDDDNLLKSLESILLSLSPDLLCSDKTVAVDTSLTTKIMKLQNRAEQMINDSSENKEEYENLMLKIAAHQYNKIRLANTTDYALVVALEKHRANNDLLTMLNYICEIHISGCEIVKIKFVRDNIWEKSKET